MAKFTIEVDSETKSAKCWVDGNEVSVSDFSVGCYQNMDCEGTLDGHTCYISLTQRPNDKESFSKSISFRTGTLSSYSESSTNYSFAKEIEKIIDRANAVSTLSKILTRDKKS